MRIQERIGALRRQVRHSTAQAAEVDNDLLMARRRLKRARLRTGYFRCLAKLRRPARDYSLWFAGVLSVGAVFAAAFACVVLALLGFSMGVTLLGALIASATMFTMLMVAINYPPSSRLPALLTDADSRLRQARQQVRRLDEEAARLTRENSKRRNDIEQLLQSDRLQRELLLDRNWKAMRGIEWEEFLAEVFDALGATVEPTPAIGDQGVDLLVRFGDTMIAVQAKGYVGAVGNDAIQQVVAGKVHYGCDRAAVITNSRFTASARTLAASNSCYLIGEQDFPAFVLGSNLEMFY